MTTPLHSALKRALTIDGRDYVLTLTDTSLKLTLKGKRNGLEMAWTQMVSGEAALAVALQASVGAFAAKNAATPAAVPKASSTQKGLATIASAPTARPQAVKPPTSPTAALPAPKRPAPKRTAAKHPAPKPLQKTRGTRKG